MDVLCDVPDNLGQEIALPGADNLTAQNLDGPAVALADTVARSILDGKGPVARFAGLGGYILAKTAAAARRQKTKDFYDLVYVLLYNDAGGPPAAADAAREAAVGDVSSYLADIRIMRKLFGDAEAEGPAAFAREMVGMGDEPDGDVLRQDAVAAVAAFADRIDAGS